MFMRINYGIDEHSDHYCGKSRIVLTSRSIRSSLHNYLYSYIILYYCSLFPAGGNKIEGAGNNTTEERGSEGGGSSTGTGQFIFYLITARNAVLKCLGTLIELVFAGGNVPS
jgi:hypothetical protein